MALINPVMGKALEGPINFQSSKDSGPRVKAYIYPDLSDKEKHLEKKDKISVY